MKKWLLILMLMGLLSGCADPEAYETVSDTLETATPAKPMQMILDMPQEAAQPTLQKESTEKLYHCDGYTLSLQSLAGGDLERTLKTVTGRGREELTVMQTLADFGSRYDCVWTAAGETGMQLGRACILEDGSYHYVLSVMAPEEETGRLQETWQNLFATCRLVDGDKNLNICS